jgi:hypothetical protein
LIGCRSPPDTSRPNGESQRALFAQETQVFRLLMDYGIQSQASLRAQRNDALNRLKCSALDFVIKQVFRISIRESDEEKSSAKILGYTNERTFFRQYHAGLWRAYDFLNPQFFTCIHKKLGVLLTSPPPAPFKIVFG